MSTSKKTVLITGATAGIGRMTALHLAKLGHHVIATGRKVAELAKVKEEAGSLHVDTLLLDVTSADSIAAAVSEVDKLTAGAGLDVLVNNAGFGHRAAFEQTPADDFRAQIDANLYGVVHLMRAALPVMRAQRGGHIINVSSVGGRIGSPGLSAYQAAKWAVGGLTEVVALEAAPFGVKVVALPLAEVPAEAMA